MVVQKQGEIVEAQELLPWASRPLEPEYMGARRTSDAQVESEKPSPTSLDGFHEGTVKLRVILGASGRKVIRFLSELRREQQVRLLQLICDRNGGVEIWLKLVAPLPLEAIFLHMDVVSQVDAPRFGPRGAESLLNVQFA